jgi:hypothetical protein
VSRRLKAKYCKIRETSGSSSVVERDLAKVDVAGSTPVSRSRVLLEKPRAGEGFFNVPGRGTQVVRERSAKPLYVGSIPTRASNLNTL